MLDTNNTFLSCDPCRQAGGQRDADRTAAFSWVAALIADAPSAGTRMFRGIERARMDREPRVEDAVNYDALFAAMRARARSRIDTAMAVQPRGRSSHRKVVAVKPIAGSDDDSSSSDDEPPGELIAVATVTPDGRDVVVAVHADPTDTAEILRRARIAAGHSPTSAGLGLTGLASIRIGGAL
jgi:hypothetical protein